MLDASAQNEKTLKYICVDGLNGFLRHEIHLKENGITIIHGPNGCGKTTLLDMIMYFYNKDYVNLSRIEFDNFTLIHSDLKNNTTTIKLTKKNYLINEVNKFEVKNNKAKGTKKYFLDESEHYLFSQKIDFFSIYFSINNEKEYFLMTMPISPSAGITTETYRNHIKRKLIEEKIFHLNQGDLFNDIDMYFDPDILRLKKSGHSHYKNSEILNEYANSFKFFMVKTQRLIYLPPSNESKDKNFSRYMIEQYAKDLSNKISQSVADSTEKTESHNKSFPERLIQNINNPPTTSESEGNIREKYKETQEKITKILNAGFLFREKNISLPDDSLENENIKTVLYLYLQDLNERLAVYDDLLSKIEAFRDIIGNKINNKDLHIQFEKGFYFTSKYGDKKELKLSDLSSGEQHQIVLFYELIFLAETGTYYLIDEPEISLHVDWQRSFLDDILRVEKLRGHKFIIATHSPQIIGSKRSLCVALDGGIL